MISIIIPLYNKENQIQKTLDSVFSQTFQDFEVIIVNDGSTDKSIETVKVYCKTHNIPLVEDKGIIPNTSYSNTIRLINQSNAGVSKARNTGIENAQGEFIAFLDADDEWKPDYLETQANLIKKYPDAAVFATNYEFKNSDGKITPTILNKIPFEGQDGILANYFQVASCSHPPLWTSAIVAKKTALQEIEGFPCGITSGEDLLTWARLYIIGDIAFTKTIGAVYNLGEGYDYSKLPPRRQDDKDPVGKSLLELYKSNNSKPGFRKYIGHWHKMRASVAIRYGERQETLKESFISLKYNPINYKVVPFIILALSPKFINRRIFSLKKHV